MSTAELSVAETILAQLGGNKFVAMTGAKNILGDKSKLQFQLPRNFAKSGINSVVIELLPSDTYKMVFYKLGTARNLYAPTIVSEVEGCQFDQLQDIFTRTTGLYTRL